MSYGRGRQQRSHHEPARGRRRRPTGLSLRLIMAVGIVAFSFISYMAKTDTNQVTGEKQRVAMSEAEEVRLGVNATPEMIREHGGLYASREAQRLVTNVGNRLYSALSQELASKNIEIPYPFEFHLLADPRTVNAFALPGGQIFITFALYEKLESEAQLAGVLGHEIGHVIERHGAERMAKHGLWQGLSGAAGVIGGDVNSARMAQMVAQYKMMEYSRNDELESDRWGVLLTTLAGYNPRAMLGVMDILEKASGGGSQPEMLSTHPRPANRKAYIEERIKEYFPDGLPPGLRD